MYRNRKVNAKGGIALGYKKELAPFVVKVAEGVDDNEFILARVTCFEPNLLIGIYYGNQEQTAGETKINNHLSELFAEIDPFIKQGLSVLIGGDFNLHIGDIIPGNEKSVSRGGKLLIELCNEFGLDFANKVGPLPNHTHFDATSKTSRILDLVITNTVSLHKRCDVDVEKEVTPFRIKSNKGDLL